MTEPLDGDFDFTTDTIYWRGEWIPRERALQMTWNIQKEPDPEGWFLPPSAGEPLTQDAVLRIVSSDKPLSAPTDAPWIIKITTSKGE